MGDRAQPGRPIDRRSVIIAHLQLGQSRQRPRYGPFDASELKLDLGNSSNRIVGTLEDDKPAVTLAPRLDRDTVVLVDSYFDLLVMEPKGVHHGIGSILPETCTALDVSE